MRADGIPGLKLATSYRAIAFVHHRRRVIEVKEDANPLEKKVFQNVLAAAAAATATVVVDDDDDQLVDAVLNAFWSCTQWSDCKHNSAQNTMTIVQPSKCG